MAKEQTKAVEKTEHAPAKFDPKNIQVVGHIVLPSLSLKGVKTGDTKYFKFLSEIASKDQVEEDGVNKGQPKMNKDGTPAQIHIVKACDMETGELGQLVIPAIPYSSFVQAGVLAGRGFAWKKGVETTGKATKWEVVEFAV